MVKAGQSPRTFLNKANELVERGLLERRGAGPNVSYRSTGVIAKPFEMPQPEREIHRAMQAKLGITERAVNLRRANAQSLVAMRAT